MSCTYIFDLATGLWQNFGEPTSISVSFISGKLTSNAFLGQLDSLIYKCHTVISGCIEPPLDPGEQAIYSLLYQGDYYRSQISAYIGAAGVKKVLSVREGDSSVTLQNGVSSAQVIRGMSQDYLNQAKELADLYNRGLATARGVDFYTINQYGPSCGANGSDFNR